MTSMSGDCLCSAVSFTAEDADTNFHACHCGMCRRWAGGPMFAAGRPAIPASQRQTEHKVLNLLVRASICQQRVTSRHPSPH